MIGCHRIFLAILLLAASSGAAKAQVDTTSNPEESAVPALPMPDSDPLTLDATTDPIILFLQRTTTQQDFARYIEQAIRANAAIDEAVAGIAEASASRREARAGLFPTIDIGLSARTSIARNFSNDPDNILERSRSTGRTDATFSVNQTVLDFGATSIRISAASARLRAAEFEAARQADEVALQAIAAWYDVCTYRMMVHLTEQFIERQINLREAIQMRVRQGVSAQADIVTVDALIAISEALTARYLRELANAETRFTSYFDVEPPPNIVMPAVPEFRFSSRDAVHLAAARTPAVEITRAQSRAALQDSRAARSDTLPRVTAGIEGGRFGIFENDNDYDIRGVVSLQYRLFGAADARADQARALARAAEARAERVREDAVRLALIAWTDVDALEQELAAAERGYLTARQSRDVVLTRFENLRGSLFDVIDAERRYAEATTAYIASTTELGAAHYVLLSRTGGLLSTLGITVPNSAPTLSDGQ
ncbi:TolC family protein [Parasphingopyxis sp.]|uniref:TolC family protein n=1 Tax=Parasphingopyxis sp. TaxID=1920299 RepID=UPI0026076B56|nr:TolC family protein [Parasphingopyxis sp.]